MNFRFSLLLVACLLGFGKTHAQKKNQEKPNIIVLLTDDQVFLALGASGNSQIKTPNMDRLAHKGVRFTNGYATTSICAASRANVMSGMYEYKTGTNFQHGSMSRDIWENSYPMLLKEAGYKVGFAGKFGFAVTPKGEGSNYHEDHHMPAADFDWWAGGPGQTYYQTSKNPTISQYADEYPHCTRAYGAAVSDFMAETVAEDDGPFCMSLSFKAPHSPYSPDPAFDSVYANVIFEKPANYGKANAQHLAKQSKLGRQYSNTFPRWSGEKYQETLTKYYQLVYGVDYAIGMIMDEIEALGIEDNTVIVFTSDNGYSCGAHGFGDKVLPYEEGSKVPMIVFDPRSKNSFKGTTCPTVTGNIDVAPTVLDLAGVKAPKDMDGISMMSMVNNPKLEARGHMPLIQVWGSAPTVALSIVTSEWKYIYWPYANKMEASEELFHLTEDPIEMINLAKVKGYEGQLNTMRELYDIEQQKWVDESLDRNGYECFGIIFNRNLSWEEKAAVVPKSMTKTYNNLVNKGKNPLGVDLYDYDAVILAIEAAYSDKGNPKVKKNKNRDKSKKKKK